MTGAVVSVVTATALAAVASIHVYWALGGRWSRDIAVPEVDGNRVFDPHPLSTLGVGVALLVAATVALGEGLGGLQPPLRMLGQAACVTVGGVFLLRALGDFRLVGLTKRVRDTRFAVWDSRLYTPLCVVFGVAFMYLAWV